MLVEVRDHDEKKHILIERYLEGNYEKFNNNKGFVKGHLNKITETLGDLGLEVIEEESDDDSKSEDDDDVSDSWVLDHDLSLYSNVTDHMFPQAFSHYSFEKSNKALMVVDLQGVFEKKSDGSRKFVFTDPAIHTKNRKRKSRHNFGRTDAGRKGMKAFFESHTCTDACRLLGLQEVNPRTLQF